MLTGSLLAGGTASAHDVETTSGGAATHSRDGAGRQLAALKQSLAAYQDASAAEAAGFIPVRSTGRFAGATGTFTVERFADAATGVGGVTRNDSRFDLADSPHATVIPRPRRA